jgi:hypothetical protein
VRLEARRGAFVVAFTVRPLPGGRPASPVELQGLAARRVERLRSSLPGFRLREERGARPYGAPGYQLGWRSRDVVARELFAVPEEDRRSAGVLLALHRSRVRGGLDAAQQRLFDAGRRTWFSFRFTR